ncbi:MAG TPA: TonB-dependent receptor [Lysobacter sp.]
MARTFRLSLAIAGALAAMGGPVVPAYAQEAVPATVRFVIPAGSLDRALQALATQSRLQILYDPSLVEHERFQGLQATLPPEQALELLLRDAGLQAARITPNTFLIERAPPPAVAPAPPVEREPVELAAVEVTGTHIPRASIDIVTPVPLTRISRAQIEASGFQTLFEVLAYQPGMISHHPVDVATDGGFQSQQPFAAAATTSLYGLGPRATLILVDGRRVANYGLASADLGGLTDLNGIPLSLVDRIEIIRGGASAIYGADAMAGVINIILRKDQTGSEVVARYGLSEQGDAEERRVSFSHGQATAGGGNLFLGADYFHRDALLGQARDWRSADLRRFGLRDSRLELGYVSLLDLTMVRPACPDEVRDADGNCYLDVPQYLTLQPEMESGAVYARLLQPLGGSVDFDASLRLGQVQQRLQGAPLHGTVPLPFGHPDDLFENGVPTALDYAFFDIGPVRSRSNARSADLDLGVSGDWSRWQWRANLSHHRNRVDNQIDGLVSNSALTQAVQDVTYRFNSPDNPQAVLDALSPRVEVNGEARYDDLVLAFNGPWFALPGGETQVALGLEWTRDALRNEPDARMLAGDVALGAQKSYLNDHRYGSAFYAELSLPFTSWLHADAAWRVDHRQSYGTESSPMLGLKWNPVESLTVRGTAATGYRAPSLFELRRPSVAGSIDAVPMTDALAPCRITASLGGVSYCLVEHGAIENPDLQPETSRSYTLGAVWAPTPDFDLSLDRFRIHRRNEIVTTDALGNPEAFPVALERDEQGRLVAINEYFTNVGRTHVEGWELQSEYRLDTERAGRFTFRLAASYLEKLERQLGADMEMADFAGHGSPKRSVLAGVEWAWYDWTSTLNVHQLGPVEIAAPGQPCPEANAAVGKCRTPSVTTADLYVAYGGLANWRLSLNINNLTDREPRNYDALKGGYDIAYDDPRGRYYLLSAAYRF